MGSPAGGVVIPNLVYPITGDWNAEVEDPARMLGASVCGDGRADGLCDAPFP